MQIRRTETLLQMSGSAPTFAFGAFGLGAAAFLALGAAAFLVAVFFTLGAALALVACGWRHSDREAV